MFRGFRRFAGLSSTERALFLRALVGLVVTDIGLRLGGLPPLVEHALPPSAACPHTVTAAEFSRAREYVRWLDTAARYHFAIRARCLHRSLTLHRWLRGEGLPSQVRIGVRKEAGALRAHAWVELGNQVVTDEATAIAPFTPLTGPGELGGLRRSGLPALQWL